MNKWNKLCEEMDQIIIHMDLWENIKTEGNKLQEERDTYKEQYEGIAESWTEINEELEANQEALGKVFNKLADEQQKLEAIRNHIDAIPTWLTENFKWEKRTGSDSWDMWKFSDWIYIAEQVLNK